MPKSKQLKPQPQPKTKAQKAPKPQPKALPATKAPKFKALGPLQKAKAKADLLPRRPKDIAKEASSHRPDWPAPAPYRYLKLDKRNDTGFTRRSRRAPPTIFRETVDLTLEEPARGPPRLLILAAAAAALYYAARRLGPQLSGLARNLF
eukprot:tig00021603_g22825.t1